VASSKLELALVSADLYEFLILQLALAGPGCQIWPQNS